MIWNRSVIVIVLSVTRIRSPLSKPEMPLTEMAVEKNGMSEFSRVGGWFASMSNRYST